MRMRIIAIVGVLLAVGAVISTTGRKATAATKVCTLKVEGLTCVTCEPPVKKAAKAIAGVSDANVSWQAGTAEITYDPAKTSPEAIAKIISEKTRYKAAVPKPQS